MAATRSPSSSPSSTTQSRAEHGPRRTSTQEPPNRNTRAGDAEKSTAALGTKRASSPGTSTSTRTDMPGTSRVSAFAPSRSMRTSKPRRSDAHRCSRAIGVISRSPARQVEIGLDIGSAPAGMPISQAAVVDIAQGGADAQALEIGYADHRPTREDRVADLELPVFPGVSLDHRDPIARRGQGEFGNRLFGHLQLSDNPLMGAPRSPGYRIPPMVADLQIGHGLVVFGPGPAERKLRIAVIVAAVEALGHRRIEPGLCERNAGALYSGLGISQPRIALCPDLETAALTALQRGTLLVEIGGKGRGVELEHPISGRQR